MHTNCIEHYLSSSGIRLTLADTTKAAAAAEDIHHMPPVSAMILAKAMTGAAVLTNDFKNHEGVTFKWVTGSPLGNIHVDAYDGHFVRGYLDHPEAGLGALPTAEEEARLVSSQGQLFVTRYSLLKMPYTSAVNVRHGDVAACLTEYLNTSEQTLSAVKLGVTVDEKGQILHSAGFLAQLMPDGNIETFASLFRDLDQWDFTAQEKASSSIETLLAKGHFDLLKKSELSFRCTCSEDRIRAALVSLPEAEKKELLQDASIESVCHYCGKKYTISRDVLTKWFEEAKGEKVQ